MLQDAFQMQMDQITGYQDICIYEKHKNNIMDTSYSYSEQHKRMA